MSLLAQHGSMLRRAVNDPYWSSVVSQHNWPGANASTTFTDATGKTWTGHGNARIDTSLGQALLLDGSGDYVTTADHAEFNLGSNQFTEEGFFLESVRGTDRQIIGQHSTQSAVASSFLLLSNNGRVGFHVFIGGSVYSATNAAQHALDTIHHYACVRDADNVFRLYVNGVQVASVTQAGSLNDSPRDVCIGAVMRNSGPDPSGYFFNGHIFSRRMTNGVCRYPGGVTFAPPAYPFPEA